MRVMSAAALITAVGSIAMAQTTPPPAPSTAAGSMQQAFESATQLTDKGNWADALAAWEALEKRPRASARTLAIIRIRKSVALRNLGRFDEAAEAARLGLAALPANDPTLIQDRFVGETQRGAIAYRALDYVTAADALAKAAAIAPSDADKASTLLSLVTVQTFVDPAAADASLARLKELTAKMTLKPAETGNLLIAETELRLNQGRFRDAVKVGQASVNAFGGLSSSNVDLNDAVARSNTAIAMLLAGDPESARRFLAYSGAGQSTQEFRRGIEMPVPFCGAEDGLKPEDLAVVEFSIGEDGNIVSARPVYAVGGAAAGLAFARGAREWSFDPAKLKTLPPFFRKKVRVELRCSTAFPHPSLTGVLDTELSRWLQDNGAPEPERLTTVARRSRDLARLADLERQGTKAGAPLVATLVSLADNPGTPREDAHRYAEQALALLDPAAPPVARLSLAARTLETAQVDRRWAAQYQAGMQALLESPAYRDDPRARAAIRLLIADRLSRKHNDEAVRFLEPVAQDGALPATDAFKIGALIRLASIEAQRGHAEAARAAFERSGLDAEQCALVDAAPKLLGVDGEFPQEAQNWGFEGWTVNEVDVGADGSVPQARSIVSYPPFVFTAAGVQTVKNARFTKTYRPSGGVGCRARPMRINFSMGK